MNTSKIKTGRFSLFGSLFGFLVLLALIWWRLPAMAQGVPSVYQTGAPNFWRTDTNATPITLTNGQTATFPAGGTNSLKQILRQDHGMSVFVQVISSNSTPGTGYLGWDVSPDNTATFTTTHPLWFTFPTTASAPATLTTNVFWTNWPPTVLNNLRSLQLTVATNSLLGGGPTTNSIQVKLTYSYSVNNP